MKKNKKNKLKFSLGFFIWLGFNYTVGIGFIGNFNSLANADAPHPIGMNLVWLFLLEGVIAGLCAWAFAKMARVHHSDNNGAAYIYIRSGFGRFWGWFCSFAQYISLPFIIALQIMMLIKGSFDPSYTNGGPLDVHWGNFTGLILDIIGIVIYLLAFSVIFGGMRIYKILSAWTGIIKWVTAFLLVLAGLYLAVKHGHDNYQYWIHGNGNNFSAQGFLDSFTSCFFFFAGFETFSTSGKNIENPEKNIGRGILIIMVISTFFYIVVSLIFFAGYNTFAQNMNIAAWSITGDFIWGISLAGAIIMVISSVALKIQVGMMNALYGGTSMQPMAKEGYISDRFRKLNKSNMPVRASMLNLVISCVIIFIWLIIPDIIKGFYPSFDALNVSMMTAASSAITTFIYFMVICVMIKYAAQHKIRMQMWEWVLFPIVLLILAVTFVYHYVQVIMNFMVTAQMVSAIVEIVFIVVVILFIVIWYYAYYLPKFNKRLIASPEIQKRLDAQFQLVDDWYYVSREVNQDLKEYLRRNYSLHENYDNENYEYAASVHELLKKVIKKHDDMVKARIKKDNDYIDE